MMVLPGAAPAAPAPSNLPAPPCPLSPLDPAPAPAPLPWPCAPRDRDSWDADTKGTADTGDMAAALDNADEVDISAAVPARGWGTFWSCGLLATTGVPSTDMASWPGSFHAVRTTNCSLGCRRTKFIGTFNSLRFRWRFNFSSPTRRNEIAKKIPISIICFCFSLFIFFVCFLFLKTKERIYWIFFSE